MYIMFVYVYIFYFSQNKYPSRNATGYRRHLMWGTVSHGAKSLLQVPEERERSEALEGTLWSARSRWPCWSWPWSWFLEANVPYVIPGKGMKEKHAYQASSPTWFIVSEFYNCCPKNTLGLLGGHSGGLQRV